MTPELRAASARRVIGYFYIFQTSFTFLIWMPIFYDYQRQMGLDDTQIFGIQSLYYLSFCMMEFPTGFLADRFGHRQCMQVGSALQILTNLIPVFWVTYWGFLSHWLLLALCRSLISGASSAYLYNYLEDLGHVDLYKDAEGRARAYSLVAKVLGFAAVGPLMNLGVSMPYSLSAAASVLAFLVAVRLPPQPAAPTNQTVQKPRASLVLRLVLQRPILPLLMLQGV
jgi:MFS family permease